MRPVVGEGSGPRVVIGIDPSFTRTGVAVWREGRVSTFAIPTTPGDGTRVRRERLILGKILPCIGPDDQVVAIVEAVYMSKFKGRSVLDLAGLHDVIVYALHARGVTVGVAVPQCPKILATGKGNATKPQMVVAAYADLGVEVGTQDEADAAWLMSAGVIAGGGKVYAWGVKGDDAARWKAVTGITWEGSYAGDWLKDVPRAYS